MNNYELTFVAMIGIDLILYLMAKYPERALGHTWKRFLPGSGLYAILKFGRN